MLIEYISIFHMASVAPHYISHSFCSFLSHLLPLPSPLANILLWKELRRQTGVSSIGGWLQQRGTGTSPLPASSRLEAAFGQGCS